MQLVFHTSADMSFLTIPSQEGLFTAIKTGKAAEEGARSRADEDDNEDEEEEDDAEDVHLIPRCSPVPRKRGSSIFDETAEYMRIHQALCTGKRVSFADTTGGDLVDVREFHAFDSDEEEGSAKWEEEEAKYRKPAREPRYSVIPGFHAPAGGDLLRAVRAAKVEVEQICPVEDEPLAFSGLIRVLNVSFHKAVYIRSTLDSWATYFDHPAEYVQGSNDGETDQFSFKLSFAPPYTTHGSRIEFVVRYETSGGDYWANNASLNYVVKLLLSYEDDPVQNNTDAQQKRSILKPCKVHSVEDDYDDDDDDGEASEVDQEKAEEEPENSTPRLVRPAAVCPVIVQPDIDIENSVQPSGSSVPLDHRPPPVAGTPSTRVVFQAEQLPHTPSETTLQADSTVGPNIGESDRPDESQPSPRRQCEPQKNTEQSINSSPSALLPALAPLSQESKGRSDESQSERVESPDSECPSATEVKLLSTTREDGLTELEPPAERVGFETKVAVRLTECTGRLSEISMKSEAHHVGSTVEPSSPLAETAASIGAEGEAPPLPDLPETPSVNPRTTVEASQVPQYVSASGENGEASQNALADNSSNTLLDLSEPWSEHDINRNLMPCVFILSGVVSLSVVMQEPSALFFIGLLLVLHRL